MKELEGRKVAACMRKERRQEKVRLSMRPQIRANRKETECERGTGRSISSSSSSNGGGGSSGIYYSAE